MNNQSFIIKFMNVESRDQFLDLLHSGAPDLLDKIIPAKTSPNAVAQNLTPDEVSPNVKFFRDFNHQPFVDQ